MLKHIPESLLDCCSGNQIFWESSLSEAINKSLVLISKSHILWSFSGLRQQKIMYSCLHAPTNYNLVTCTIIVTEIWCSKTTIFPSEL